MKKTRFLAMTLVVAIMMMGAGYAYWSQDLTINNTVDTGVLAVTFQEPANVDGEDLNQPNADMTPNGESATIRFTDVYPGASNELYFDLRNDGTLGAYVAGFEIENDDAIYPGGGVTNYINKVIKVDNLYVGTADLGDGYTLATALTKLNEYNSNLGVSVPFGGKTRIGMTLTFDPTATENEMPEDGVFTFDITADVHQFNDTTR